MSRIEYRVVWKRRGQHQKSKRFMSLKSAERRVLLLGPEPWKAFGVDPDEQHCCHGHECACGGATWREYLLEQRDKPGYEDAGPMPAIEYIRIDQRPLGAWCALREEAQ
jgi:hypothetical protein